MRSLKLLVCLYLGATLTMFGQGGTPSNNLTLFAPAPPPVQIIGSGIVGQAGIGQSYYWVVANYPIGKIISQPLFVTNVPTTLSVSNYVRISWAANVNAVNYDILKTSTAVLPNNCVCSIALGVVGSSYNDQGGGSSVYAIQVASSTTSVMSLDNTHYLTPRLILGTFFQDLYVVNLHFIDGTTQITAGGGGGGTGNVVGPASSTDSFLPQWDGTTGKLLKNGLAVSATATADAVVQADSSNKIALAYIKTLATTGVQSIVGFGGLSNPTNGNCAQWDNNRNVVDSGGPCGGGGGAGPAQSVLTDVVPTITTTTLTNDSLSTASGVVGNGKVIFNMSAGKLKVTGVPTSDVTYTPVVVFVDSNGVLTFNYPAAADSNGTLTKTCTNCVYNAVASPVVPDDNQFPVGTLSLVANTGVWSFSTLTDTRAAFRIRQIEVGTGLVWQDPATKQVLQTDPDVPFLSATVNIWTGGNDFQNSTVIYPWPTVSSDETVGGACSNHNSVVVNKTNGRVFYCLDAGTWAAVGTGAVTRSLTIQPFAQGLTFGGVAMSSIAGQTTVYRFVASGNFTVNTITFNCSANIAATNAYVGVYSAAGTLIGDGTVSTATAGIKSVSVSALPLVQGTEYYMAVANDTATTVTATGIALSATQSGIANAGTTKSWGTCANGVSAGHLATSCGAIAAGAVNFPQLGLVQ